jgi:hypothetical protein
LVSRTTLVRGRYAATTMIGATSRPLRRGRRGLRFSGRSTGAGSEVAVPPSDHLGAVDAAARRHARPAVEAPSHNDRRSRSAVLVKGAAVVFADRDGPSRMEPSRSRAGISWRLGSCWHLGPGALRRCHFGGAPLAPQSDRLSARRGAAERAAHRAAALVAEHRVLGP